MDFWVDAFNSNYETQRFEVAIMTVNNEDIGAGGYGLSRDYADANIGEITSIYFLDKVWGKGYSQELMNFMINRLREMGYEKVHLWAVKDNPRASRFYEKCGFECTGNKSVIKFKGESVNIV